MRVRTILVAALVLAALVWPAAAEDTQRNDPQVDFKLYGYARAGQPIKWSLVATLGNTVKDMTGYISSPQPLQGQTTCVMTLQTLFDWYGGGVVTFPRAGQTVIMASVKYTSYGNTLILSRTFTVTVHPAGD